jgi:hypothetical protein
MYLYIGDVVEDNFKNVYLVKGYYYNNKTDIVEVKCLLYGHENKDAPDFFYTTGEVFPFIYHDYKIVKKLDKKLYTHLLI